MEILSLKFELFIRNLLRGIKIVIKILFVKLQKRNYFDFKFQIKYNKIRIMINLYLLFVEIFTGINMNKQNCNILENFELQGFNNI